MPGIEAFSPKGMLHKGWSAQVEDYAITCGWVLQGKAFLVGDSVGGIYAFEGKSGDVIWNKKEVHKGGLLAMSIHPDGNSFSTAGQDGQVLIWDSKEGQLSKVLDLGKGWAENIKWSPDGNFLAVTLSRYVYVFCANGQEQWCSGEHPSTVSAIEWSKSNELATACYGRVTFFDVVNKKVNQKLEWQGSLISMVLSPNGDIVVCGSQDNSVHFWRRSTNQDSEMTGYPGKPSQLAFDHSGTLLATGGSEIVTVWSFHGNGPEGTVPGQLTLHNDFISSLSFSHNGMLLASAARDGSVFVWFLNNNGQGDPVGGAFAGELVSQIAWRPDDCALAAVNAKGGIIIWDFKVRTETSAKGFA
ncbi:hypothetical protein [Prochlorococcus sp. MIT 1223]|uniref:WD40 repeat domain-containing protein n=1 Tax=Prochlorococcus sp. MIT 1223 TaxID=3096217 RepID=UPI002A758124|nr:hypothetical protein [Prochlorococcus sp. MIT 1223]